MKKIHILAALVTLFINSKVVANPFFNFKEGRSELIGNQNRKKLINLLLTVDKVELLQSFQQVFDGISNQQDACSFTILNNLKEDLSQVEGVNFDTDIESLLVFGRDNNIFDDIVYRTLKLNYKMWDSVGQITTLEDKEPVHYNNVVDETEISKVQDWRNDLKDNKCLVDSSLTLFYKLTSEIKKEKRKKRSKRLKKLLKKSLTSGNLKTYEYKFLETLRKNNILKMRRSLGSYYHLLNNLNRTSLREDRSLNDFVSKHSSKKALSLRENLIYNYDFYQIRLMSDLMNRFKERMEAYKVNILVYGEEDSILETILLSPMEQYRFSVKMIRKEITELKMLPRFRGVDPKYGDFITAAFETGLLQAEELDSIAQLEFLWNPKLTKKQKIMKYTKQYGGIAQILIPPPYNLAFPLFLTLLEYFTYEAIPNGAADITNIF